MGLFAHWCCFALVSLSFLSLSLDLRRLASFTAARHFLFCCFLLLQITQKRRKTFFSLSTTENERATTENFLSLFFSLLALLAALALGGGAGVLLGHGVDLVEDGALFFLLK